MHGSQPRNTVYNVQQMLFIAFVFTGETMDIFIGGFMSSNNSK